MIKQWILWVIGALFLIVVSWAVTNLTSGPESTLVYSDDEVYRDNFPIPEIVEMIEARAESAFFVDEEGQKAVEPPSEIQMKDESNELDISTDIIWQDSSSTAWMTIAFDPEIQAKIIRGWGHDAESVRIMTSMSQEFNAYDRLNKAMGELINLDLEKAAEILVRHRITYHPDSKTQIGYKAE